MHTRIVSGYALQYEGNHPCIRVIIYSHAVHEVMAQKMTAAMIV